METRIAGFGESRSLDYVDDGHHIVYYKDLVDGILSQPGAEEGVTVRAAPYDFRYSPPSKESQLYFDRWALFHYILSRLTLLVVKLSFET